MRRRVLRCSEERSGHETRLILVPGTTPNVPPHTPLRAPREYFQRYNRPSLTVGAGVVLAQALAFVVVIWLFVGRVFAHVDVPAGTVADRSAMIGPLFWLVVSMVVGWLVVAAILHVFVWFADGRRGFGTTLAIVGEAEFVGLVIVPVAAVALFGTIGGMPTDPEAAMAYIENASAMGTPLLNVVGFVGTIWRAVVTGYGLSVAQDIDHGKAFVLSFAVGLLGFLIGLA